MLWACSVEVMEDMWRARFGTEMVYWRCLEEDRRAGDMNDWPYVARVLEAAGFVRRIKTTTQLDRFYQLKE